LRIWLIALLSVCAIAAAVLVASETQRSTAQQNFSEAETASDLLADMLEPAVTVVAQDPRAIGTLAAQLLFLRMDGDIAPTALHVVPTRLIARGSGEIARRAA